MKKLHYFFFAVMLVCSLSANAQSKAGADYFNGAWNVLIKGTPDGDAKMVLQLERKDSVTLMGVVLDTAGTEVSKISAVTLKDEEISVSFRAQGYDLVLVLTKKDEDHANGMLINMFEAEAVRKKM